ncbi:TPA: hypothetical protein ACX6S4_000378 [Photobacterium damselae]
MRNPETNPISLFFKAVTNNHIGLISVILVITCCYFWLAGKPVPNELNTMTFSAIAYLFGRGSKE